MAKRPADLTYWVNETPPAPALLLLSLQHLALVAIFLVVAVSVARIGGLDEETGGKLVALTMIGGGIGAILQAFGRYGVGSGLHVPTTTTTILLPSAGAALTMGGPALLLGMTLFSGLVVVALSRIIHRLRPLFPPEVAGFVVFMIGISVMVTAGHQLLGVDIPADRQSDHLWIGMPTLALIVGISVWGDKNLRLYSTLIGVTFGYVAAVLLDGFAPGQARSFFAAPLLAAPDIGGFGLDFKPALILPFLIAALAMALNTMGAVTAAQKANDAEWRRPDMRNIGQAIMADGLTNVLTSLIGGCGQSSTSGAVGLSVATGATSRAISFCMGALLIVLACSPKVATAMLIMPPAVIGATLMFSGCFLVLNGVQVMASRLLDSRKVFVLGLSLAFGLSRLFDPQYFHSLPDTVQPWVSSPMALAVTMAVALNALFRIGIHRRSQFMIDGARLDAGRLDDFMMEQGKLWGADAAVVYRAAFATQETVETLAGNDMLRTDDAGRSMIEVRTRFDEFSFTVTVSYDGDLLRPRAERPSPEEIVESDDGAKLLAAYMIGKAADRVRADARKARNEINLTFNS
jgi:xanthine permease XanP